MTCYKRYAVNPKHITTKIDLDKIPTLLNKKIKTKKPQTVSIRNHQFIETLLPIKSTCYKCSLPFWGIGYQGLYCQSKSTRER